MQNSFCNGINKSAVKMKYPGGWVWGQGGEVSKNHSQHRCTRVPFHFRMVSAMLTVLRSQYSALKDSDLATSSHDSDYHELEQLVLRERGVVWADQREAEGCTEAVPSQLELASILGFSHLVCHKSTPCSK